MTTNYIKQALILLIVLILYGCEEPISDDVVVLQENVVYLSSERLVLTGRIVSQTQIDALDHGFLVADNEALTNPVTISLGAQDVPGRFVGSYEQLTPDTRYWAVAYVLTGNGEIRSEPQLFTSLKPAITDFSPAVAAIGEELMIIGANFTNDTKVFFEDREAEIVKIVAESIITVLIPSNSGDPFKNISVSSQGTSNTFDRPFEYVSGKWESLGAFPLTDNVVSTTIMMENEDFAFFGLGDRLFSMDLNSETFLLDKSTNQWSRLPFEGRSLVGGFASWPFFGSGAVDRNGRIVIATEFYKIENGVIEKEGDLPFALYNSFAFAFEESLFVFGGRDANRSSNTSILEYDRRTKTWSIIEGQNLFGSSESISFIYNGKGYFVGDDNVIAEFDPITKSWSQVGPYPGTVGREGFVQVVGDKAFIGLFDSRRAVAELDLLELTSKRKTIFRGDFKASNTLSWTDGSDVYLLRSNSFNANEAMIIWKLIPDQF